MLCSSVVWRIFFIVALVVAALVSSESVVSIRQACSSEAAKLCRGLRMTTVECLLAKEDRITDAVCAEYVKAYKLCSTVAASHCPTVPLPSCLLSLTLEQLGGCASTEIYKAYLEGSATGQWKSYKEL